MPLALASGTIKPSSLQWEIVVPVGEATLEASKPTATAQSLGKTLQCGGERREAAGNVSAYRCILAGGGKPLGDGDVAELRFKLLKTSGSVKIRVENGKGVSPDMKTVDFKPSEGKINVH